MNKNTMFSVQSFGGQHINALCLTEAINENTSAHTHTHTRTRTHTHTHTHTQRHKLAYVDVSVRVIQGGNKL